MKKLNIFLLVAILAIGIASCEKEESKSIQVSGSENLVYKLDEIPILKHKSNSKSRVTDINKLMTNPNDSDDEKINNYLYQISLATRDLIKDQQFNQIIIDLAQDSETYAANLLDLESEAPAYYDSINNNLADSGLSLEMIANDLTHEPVAPNPDYPVTEEIEHYVPAIFVPNLENADPSLQPLISPNVVVDSREDTTIEDNIITWFFENEQDEEVTEIMLSEQTALNTNNPVFILDNAVTSLETEIDFDFEPLNSERKKVDKEGNEGEKSFASFEHSIRSESYEYESFWSGRSEFAVQAIRIDPNGYIQFIDNDGYKVISKIEKDQIGSIQYDWKYHASNWQPWSNPWTPGVIQNGVNMVYWNTFERDWNHDFRPLGRVKANGRTFYLSGNMKYNSNWYSWIPRTTQVHYTRFEWIDYDWAHWNNSWKAKFRLWKVYI